MTKSKSYKIGNVNLDIIDGADLDSSKYSDGDSENELLEIFKSPNSKEKVQQVLATSPPWQIYYHLSPYRKNVIDWYNFRKGASVLEIGAGCGAVTEALINKGLKVTALELTKRRAEVNAHRNKNSKNLNIIVGGLDNYNTEKKFDYVICVGVLEYAGMFVKGENPYIDFVKRMNELSKSDGTVIVAIENRLGLKYFSGAREDHTGRFFDSINQYPHPKRVQTFGRKELQDIFTESGITNSIFYYPYPDYKNPKVVFSDKHSPSDKGVEFPIKILPTPGFDAEKRNRVHLFSEQLAMLSIEKNGLYSDFSNSFIVVANKSSRSDNNPYFFVDNPLRKEEYRIKTTVENRNNETFYIKSATNKVSKTHLKSIHDNYKTLIDIYKGDVTPAKPILINDQLFFNKAKGQSLERLLFESIVAGDYKISSSYLDSFINLVDKLPGKTTTNLLFIDLNFDNIIVDKTWTLIDYEWLFKKKINKDLLVTRAFIYFFYRYSPAFNFLAKRGDYLRVYDGLVVPEQIYNEYKRYFDLLIEFQDLEKWFLSTVNGQAKDHPVLNFKNSKASLASESVGFIENSFIREKEIKNLTISNNTKDGIIKNLERRIDTINQELSIEKNLSNRAQLTSVYYLPRKIIRRTKIEIISIKRRMFNDK